MGVGKRINAFCKEKKLSLRQLAITAQVPYSTLYSAVKRDSNGIDINTLQKIGTALGIPWFQLTEGMEQCAELLEKKYPGSYIGVDDNGEVVIWPCDNEKNSLAPSRRNMLLTFYDSLNEFGQNEAVNRVEELAQLPKYQRRAEMPKTNLNPDEEENPPDE